ncbi:MAG: isoprenylcysteine carboxylmethyltransferase family protein [Chthoniobacteraceae bacterium]
MPNLSSWLGVIGRRMFPFRLPIGLAVTLLAARWIEPLPFLAPRHRIIQTLGLLVIGGGLALRAWGAGSAGFHTRTGRIEAPRLATAGPFAYLRNPIYLGSILLGVGMSLLIGDPVALVIAAAAFALLYFGIVPAEEQFLLGQFGDAYRRYCEAVPRFIPRLTPWDGRARTSFHWQAIKGEIGILLVLVLIYAGLLLKELHPGLRAS